MQSDMPRDHMHDQLRVAKPGTAKNEGIPTSSRLSLAGFNVLDASFLPNLRGVLPTKDIRLQLFVLYTILRGLSSAGHTVQGGSTSRARSARSATTNMIAAPPPSPKLITSVMKTGRQTPPYCFNQLRNEQYFTFRHKIGEGRRWNTINTTETPLDPSLPYQ